MKFITLNLRATANRWQERFPIIVDLLHAEQPDFVGLQEVHLQVQQAHLIQGALNYLNPDKPYKLRVAEDTFTPAILANAILSRHEIIEHERVELPQFYRIAQYIKVEIEDHILMVANTHLHHKPYKDESIRLPQMQHLLEWLQTQSCTAYVVMGDFNARPDSETIAYAKQSLSSAYEAIHLCEPECTFPTPLIDDDFQSRTIDYIFFTGKNLLASSACLVGNTAHPDDDRLYASDHYGICAEIAFQ